MRSDKNLTEDKYEANTPLYTLEDKDFTYGDLQKRLGKLQKLYDLKEKLYFARALLLPYALLEQETDFKKSKKTPMFPFAKTLLRNKMLVLAYYQQEKDRLKVDPSEILKRYKEQKKNKPKKMSYDEAIKWIREQYKQGIVEKFMKERRAELSKKNNLTIHNKLLKADKI